MFLAACSGGGPGAPAVAYASVVPDDVAADRSAVIARAVRQLRNFGGNGGTLDAPRRTHDRPRETVIAALPEGWTLRCPTEEERTACEQGGEIFGIPLESKDFSYACDGRAGECVMADGQCVEALASEGLPVELRPWEDFLWQRSPFPIGQRVAVDGQEQSPGRDLSEPYWIARHYGSLTEGAGQVLAWRDAGGCR